MADYDLISLLYDPASYTHASHLPEMFRHAENRDKRVANFWLLKQGKLENLPEGWFPNDPLLSFLLAHWYRYYDAAYLLGSFLCREQLLRQCETLVANPRLLAFISLPLCYQVTPYYAQLNKDPRAWGASFILAHFTDLPTALQQRIRLILPAKISLPRLQVPRNLDNTNLLRIAFSYAHHQERSIT
ncbi:type III secretion protein [Tatumella ptyseos]|uniref:type III secretion protein n=1 Tax=Tatumella ptyseos TaxID=82987 RepID=UPI0026ECB1D7|nr:type III secretion protein [Tatumella ptyseos]WKX25766.1 type III secretion protein [Tatumella ptyseos]